MCNACSLLFSFISDLLQMNCQRVLLHGPGYHVAWPYYRYNPALYSSSQVHGSCVQDLLHMCACYKKDACGQHFVHRTLGTYDSLMPWQLLDIVPLPKGDSDIRL